MMLFALTCLVSCACAADHRDGAGSTPTRAQVALAISRRDVFQRAMGLDDPQKDTFWNIYADYDRQRAELTDQSVRLLSDYVTSFDTLTHEQATKMMDDAARINDKQIKLRQKYAHEISKKLDGRVGARFYQIDDYLETAIRLEVLTRIPFVGDQKQGDQERP